MTLKVDGTNGVLQAYDVQTLTTGFTYTFASGTQTLVITPAGVLATGTVTMPASPVDGMVVTVTSTQPITALTVNANTGQTINNGGALGLQAGGSLSYMYNLANTKWQPFAAGLPIAVGQTWQNVAGSRAVATNYTNTTGRPIVVTVCNTNSGASGTTGGYFTVGGVQTGTQAGLNGIGTGNLGYGATTVVPAGAVYRFDLYNGTLNIWAELR